MNTQCKQKKSMQISQFISRCQQGGVAAAATALWAWQSSIPNALSMSVLPLHIQWGRSTFTLCACECSWGHNRRHFSGTHTHSQSVYMYLCVCVFVCCNAVDIQIVTVCLTHTCNAPVSLPFPPFFPPIFLAYSLRVHVARSLSLSLCSTLSLSLFYSSYMCVCVCVFA